MTPHKDRLGAAEAAPFRSLYPPPPAPGAYLYFLPSQKTSEDTPSLSSTRIAATGFFLRLAPESVTRSKFRLMITNFALGFSARQPSLPEPWMTSTIKL